MTSGGSVGLAAAKKGCTNMIALEKAGTGGDSAMAHDLFGAESPVQKRMRVEACGDDFFKITMRSYEGITNGKRGFGKLHQES